MFLSQRETCPVSQLPKQLQFLHKISIDLVTMSVSATESDPPRFFVGGEDGEELLDSTRSTDYEHFYDHGEEEEEEYDSVCSVGACVWYSVCSLALSYSEMALDHRSLIPKWCSELGNCS